MINHHPNHDWLVNVIFMLDPDNEIFAKDYMPPKKPSKALASEE
jgi:hypothetical protein